MISRASSSPKPQIGHAHRPVFRTVPPTNLLLLGGEEIDAYGPETPAMGGAVDNRGEQKGTGWSKTNDVLLNYLSKL